MQTAISNDLTLHGHSHPVETMPVGHHGGNAVVTFVEQYRQPWSNACLKAASVASVGSRVSPVTVRRLSVEVNALQF